MLFPNKHSHPDRTTLAVAGTMMKHLARNQVVEYDALLNACRSHGPSTEFLFTPAISLLYLLGLVEYLPTSDSFAWTAKAAAS
jgi:hypothetical protein